MCRRRFIPSCLLLIAVCVGCESEPDRGETKPAAVRKTEQPKPQPPKKRGPQPEPFEASDATGHLISRGFRIKRADGNYVRTGRWTFYFPDGVTQSEGEFANDIKIGIWTEYRPATTYRKPGLIAAKKLYKNGIEVRRWTVYSQPRNRPHTEAEMRNGQRVGLMTYRYRTGEKMATHVRKLLFGVSLPTEWTLYRKNGKVFASFRDGGYVFRGTVRRHPLRYFETMGTKRRDAPFNVAWLYANRQLEKEEPDQP